MSANHPRNRNCWRPRTKQDAGLYGAWNAFSDCRSRPQKGQLFLTLTSCIHSCQHASHKRRPEDCPLRRVQCHPKQGPFFNIWQNNKTLLLNCTAIPYLLCHRNGWKASSLWLYPHFFIQVEKWGQRRCPLQVQCKILCTSRYIRAQTHLAKWTGGNMLELLYLQCIFISKSVTFLCINNYTSLLVTLSSKATIIHKIWLGTIFSCEWIYILQCRGKNVKQASSSVCIYIAFKSNICIVFKFQTRDFHVTWPHPAILSESTLISPQKCMTTPEISFKHSKHWKSFDISDFCMFSLMLVNVSIMWLFIQAQKVSQLLS